MLQRIVVLRLAAAARQREQRVGHVPRPLRFEEPTRGAVADVVADAWASQLQSSAAWGARVGLPPWPAAAPRAVQLVVRWHDWVWLGMAASHSGTPRMRTGGELVRAGWGAR